MRRRKFPQRRRLHNEVLLAGTSRLQHVNFAIHTIGFVDVDEPIFNFSAVVVFGIFDFAIQHLGVFLRTHAIPRRRLMSHHHWYRHSLFNRMKSKYRSHIESLHSHTENIQHCIIVEQLSSTSNQHDCSLANDSQLTACRRFESPSKKRGGAYSASATNGKYAPVNIRGTLIIIIKHRWQTRVEGGRLKSG